MADLGSDFSKEALNFLKSFDKHTGRVFKTQQKAIDGFLTQMGTFVKLNEGSFESLANQGRLTEEGLEKLQEQIKEGTDIFSALSPFRAKLSNLYEQGKLTTLEFEKFNDEIEETLELQGKDLDLAINNIKEIVGSFSGISTELKDIEELELSKEFELLSRELTNTIQLDKEGRDVYSNLLDSQKKIQQMSDKATTSLENAVDRITSFIPIIGDEISIGFKAKIIPKLAGRLDSIFMKTFMTKGKGGLPGGLSMTKLIGIAGAITAIIGLIKAFTLAERTIVDLVKNTGFLREDVLAIRDDMFAAYANIGKFGITLEDVSETTKALLEEFGSLGIINQKLIENAAKWSRAYSIGTEEIAKTIDVLNRSLGLTVEQIDSFVTDLDVRGRIAGVSMSLVMKDITRDANFLAIY
ncbi:MAG: hypothetical protein KJ587_19785, partial [Alphaproteobacteria bacterium]|nr:hypothetical protein [Alphaproteobacteria bacterium]